MRPTRFAIVALGAGLATALCIEVLALNLLRSPESRLLDVFVRTQAARLVPDPAVVIVDIDSASLARMKDEAGPWPWSRSIHAGLINGLAAQKPLAIVFDILFSDPDAARPEGDSALAGAMTLAKNAYVPTLRLDPRGDARGARIAELAPRLGIVRGANADPDARVALAPPLALPPSLWRTGTASPIDDADGVSRRYALRSQIGNWSVPSLAARVAMDLGFPVPDMDTIVLAWRGRAGDFPRVSYADLHADFGRAVRMRPANEFAGKIVIVGASAAGLDGTRSTPLAALHSSAEILGTAIENLKSGRHVQDTSALWPLVPGLLLITILGAAFLRNVDVRVAGAALAVATLGLLAFQYAAVGQLLRPPVLAPIAAAWLYFVVVAAMRARR